MFIKRGFFIMCQALFVVFSLALNAAYPQKGQSQTKSVDEYLSRLPAELKLEKKVPQKYHMTSYWNNRDVSGNTAGRIRITGEFTRSLKDDQVDCLWNNVRIARASGPSKPFPESELLDYMEDFSYTLSGEIMKEEFYKDFPDTDVRNIIKTLIWDAPMIEVVYMSLDNLTYNKTFRSTDFEGMTIQMANFALIKMRDLRLTWTGLSKRNGEVCALIQYKSFSNPVYSKTDAMNIKGRSCYWGSFLVSLEDKRVKYVALNEDIILEMEFPNDSVKRLINIQREVEFENIQ
ncbi:MAG: hypothetical protein PVI11_07380 [Candidatus Aminicenantes bacterium]